MALCWVIRDKDNVSDFSTVYLNKKKAEESFKESVKYRMDYLEVEVDDNGNDVDECLEKGEADFGSVSGDGYVTIEESTLIE